MSAPSERTPQSLLVTVGSTLFPALTDAILSPSTLSLLRDCGIRRLVVQYGRADLPASFVLSSEVRLDAKGCGCVKISPALGDAKTGQGQGQGQSLWLEVEVEVMRYTDDFEGLVSSCDAVISHAGSGSILTVLRQAPRPPPRLLIVPNESLMDNHQAELADELGSEGYLMVSRVEQLSVTLPRFLDDGYGQRVRPFPPREGGRFRRVLDETMGYL